MNKVNLAEEHKSHSPWSWIECISAYKFPKDQDEWEKCPSCGFHPKIWTFNNGRSTVCACRKEVCNMYNHWSIYAESIGSHYKHGTIKDYDSNELKKNWNHYCLTGEVLFERPLGGRADKRW